MRTSVHLQAQGPVRTVVEEHLPLLSPMRGGMGLEAGLPTRQVPPGRCRWTCRGRRLEGWKVDRAEVAELATVCVGAQTNYFTLRFKMFPGSRTRSFEPRPSESDIFRYLELKSSLFFFYVNFWPIKSFTSWSDAHALLRLYFWYIGSSWYRFN